MSANIKVTTFTSILSTSLLHIFFSKICFVYYYNLGCFNGTEYDDIMDESLHIKKYAVWSEGNYDLRCGDIGIHIYR